MHSLFLLPTLAQIHASHPLCNHEGLERCFPLLFYTNPFSDQFVQSQFSLIWSFYTKEPIFSLHVTYSLQTSSHLINTCQTCSHRTTHLESPTQGTGFSSCRKHQLYITGKPVLACQGFWHNYLGA